MRGPALPAAADNKATLSGGGLFYFSFPAHSVAAPSPALTGTLLLDSTFFDRNVAAPPPAVVAPIMRRSGGLAVTFGGGALAVFGTDVRASQLAFRRNTATVGAVALAFQNSAFSCALCKFLDANRDAGGAVQACAAGGPPAAVCAPGALVLGPACAATVPGTWPPPPPGGSIALAQHWPFAACNFLPNGAPAANLNLQLQPLCSGKELTTLALGPLYNLPPVVVLPPGSVLTSCPQTTTAATAAGGLFCCSQAMEGCTLAPARVSAPAAASAPNCNSILFPK